MVATPSTMVELGTPMPEFQLTDVVSGEIFSSSSTRGAPTVVAFICNHCPYVKHIRRGLAEFGEFCEVRGVNLVAISSNDVSSHPEDSPENMVIEAKNAGYRFPYLFDREQEVAHRFGAACTPDFFLFDAEGRLAYRGQFDSSRPGNGAPVTGQDLRLAAEALLAGRRPEADQRPSMGCNIKWKPGREPS